MIPTLETPRLLLAPLRIEDAEQVQKIFPQWEVVRYLASRCPWPYPDDGALTFCRDIAIPAMERGEQWHWTLRLKSVPAEVIGSISLMKGDENRGFWIAPAWQRQGLMTEAVEAVTEYWFNVLKFALLRAPKVIENVGSRRISEKTGMRMVRVEERDFVSGRFMAEIWEITAEEWRARRARIQK